MNLLDRVSNPQALRRLSREELPQLADELRDEIVSAVSETGGHFSSNLGTVELTIALHYVFDTPRDLLVWDVGHQTYPHKILTGRRDRMSTLRQYGGLSGFCLRSESEYDVVAAGHASTSISAALGLAVARDLRGESHQVVAIIGDGSMTAGMAFEAMNQAGHLGTKMIVVLNDNSMSISPSVGALTKYLEALMAGRHYAKLKDDIKKVLHRIPGIGDPMVEVAKGLEEGLRQVFTPGTLFEELGFRYIGPVNGHSIPRPARSAREREGDRRPGAAARHHPEGQGLQVRRGRTGRVPRPLAVRSGRRDPEGQARRRRPPTPRSSARRSSSSPSTIRGSSRSPPRCPTAPV